MTDRATRDDRGRVLAIVGVCVFVLALGWMAWNQFAPQDAGDCTSVDSAACQPWIQLVRKQLGAQASEITNIQGRSWCGHPACPAVFGPEPLFDLVVTIRGQATLTFQTVTFQCGVRLAQNPGDMGWCSVVSSPAARPGSGWQPQAWRYPPASAARYNRPRPVCS